MMMHSHKQYRERLWHNAEALLKRIGLKKGFTFVDVGCGHGSFALPAAKLVGSKGKVYGVDISREAIGSIKEKALKAGLKNLKLKEGRAEGAVFCGGCADIVFFGRVLHDFENPSKVLRNAKRMLKPDGMLVNLDWKKKPTPFGPPPRIRFSEEEASELIRKAGFRIRSAKGYGPYYYVITARR